MSYSGRNALAAPISMQDLLAFAEEHIAKVNRIIAKQCAVLCESQPDGHDVGMAENLLAEYEELLAMNIADRNRILAELADVKT